MRQGLEYLPSSEMLARNSLLIAVSSRFNARSARSDATASSLSVEEGKRKSVSEWMK